MESALFMDRQLLFGNAPENFRGCADMYHRIAARIVVQRLKQAGGAKDIGIQGFDGRVETGAGKTLRGKVKDIVGAGLLYRMLERNIVIEIPIGKVHAILRIDAP